MLKNIRLERPLVVLDLETTGKKVQTDRIVEISLLKLLPDGTNQIKTRRLNPGIPIPAEATAIHGITDADVANENSFRQIARSLATYLEGCDLCGYNIWMFDLRCWSTSSSVRRCHSRWRGGTSSTRAGSSTSESPETSERHSGSSAGWNTRVPTGLRLTFWRLSWSWTVRWSVMKTFP